MGVPKLKETPGRVYYLYDYCKTREDLTHPDHAGRLHRKGYEAYMFQQNAENNRRKAYEEGVCYACGTGLVYFSDDDDHDTRR